MEPLLENDAGAEQSNSDSLEQKSPTTRRPASEDSSSEAHDVVCRICHDHEGVLIRACKCEGSTGQVHAEWYGFCSCHQILTRQPQNLDLCPKADLGGGLRGRRDEV